MSAPMIREECLRTLARHHAGQIVVSVYTTCFEWLVLRPDAPNYVSVGAMGQAGSHGLGLALGRPDLEVWVFDGDGSLLMNLGCLVTLAGAQARNLTHFVFQNGCYEANGRMPLPVPCPIDFAAIARGAGVAAAATFSQADELSDWLTARRPGAGPAVVDLRVTPSPTQAPQRYDFIHSEAARDTFRAALQAIPRRVG